MTPALSAAIAKALAPLALFLFLVPLAFVRYLIQRYAPDGKLKRLLLKDV